MKKISLLLILLLAVLILPAATVTIFEEGFEGTFPGEKTTVNGDPTWDDNNHTAKTGSWSAWCSGTYYDDWDEYEDYIYGYEDGEESFHYQDEMEAKLVFGPFDLSSYSSATLSFASLVSTEEDYDYLVVNIVRNLPENQEESPIHRETGEGEELWNEHSISLKEYVGSTPIFISFEFHSDSSEHSYLGAWIDDVKLVGTR